MGRGYRFDGIRDKPSLSFLCWIVLGRSLFFLDCESIMYFSPLLKSSSSLGVVSLTVAIVAASAVPAMAGSTSALAPGAAFLKSWEKENLEGDFVEAAEEYEVLYRRPSQPVSDIFQSSSGQLDRLRAAYRAGLCFEAVDNLNRARFAYQWIERHYSRIRIDLLLEFPADRGLLDFLTMLRERSALRFRSLKAAEGESEVERIAIAEVLEEFREYNRNDTNNLENCRQQILEQRWRVAAADELAAALERGGVSGTFSDRLDTSGARGQELRDLVVTLQKSLSLKGGEEKPSGLRSYLTSCFLQRSLDALALEDTDRAGRELSVALAIDPDYVPALSLQAALDGRGTVSFLAASALRRTVRRQGLRAGKLRKSARSLVSEAESLDRRDRVLRELLRANRICCSESDVVLADEEISRLSTRIELGCIERTGLIKKREVEEVLTTARDQIRSSLGLCEELVRLFSRVLLQRSYLSGEVATAAVIGVAHEIKNETRESRVRVDKLRLERLEFKLALLERWFPEIKELIKAI